MALACSSAPTSRVYPQVGFFVAIRTTSCTMSVATVGRPVRRRAEPILAPNASCSARFTVRAIGARSSRPQTQGLGHDNNISLETPRGRHDDLFYWALMIGAGFLNPRNELVYGSEHQIEVFGSFGIGVQRYVAWPVAGAYEMNLLYEPTQTAYGTVRLTSQGGDRVTIPYHRLFAEIIGTISRRNGDYSAMYAQTVRNVRAV